MSTEKTSASVTHIDPMKVHQGSAHLEVEVNNSHFDISVTGGGIRGFSWAVERWEPYAMNGNMYAPLSGRPIGHGSARFFRDALQAAMTACREHK